MSELTIRGSLNAANPNRIADAERAIGLGELINSLLLAKTATESGLSPSSNVVTLAATPSALFDVNATAGTVTGHKKLLQGPITGTEAVIPATGQVTWDGGTKLLFAAADVVTTVAVKYATAADLTVSLLQRAIGEIDS